MPKLIYIPAPTSSFPYLFDEFGVAEYGFSFQKLSSSYTEACFRIRRDNDDAETDVNFDGDGISLSSTVSAGGDLGTWLGANDAYISKMYNQGIGTDMSNPTTSQQLRIAASGVLDTVNGHVSAWNLDGTTQVRWLEADASDTFGVASAFYYGSNTDGNFKYYMSVDNGSFRHSIRNSNNDRIQTGINGTNYTNTTVISRVEAFTLSVLFDSTVKVKVEGNATESIAAAAPSSTGKLRLRAPNGSPTLSPVGYFSEYVLYKSDKSADFQNIEDNIVSRLG